MNGRRSRPDRLNLVRVLLLALASTGCSGTTGGELIHFRVEVRGPTVDDDRVYRFDTPLGYRVELTKATLLIGAVYLNQSRPTSVASDTNCFLQGVYVAEAIGAATYDLLDGKAQPFPELGRGTTERPSVAELWLTSGPVEAPTDPQPIVVVEGQAFLNNEVFPFDGRVTISSNRSVPPPNPAQPGGKPLCKQRIVTPIVTDFSLTADGTLAVEVDPAGWFRNVDFRAVERVSNEPPLYRLRDDSDDAPSRNFYAGVRASAGTYQLSFRNESQGE